MSRLRGLALLMIITILAITGFQLYWLRQNYGREEKSLEVKTELAFRQTILRLQVSKLKLDTNVWTTRGGRGDGNGKVRIVMNDGLPGSAEEMDIHLLPKEGVVSTINVIRDKLKDSLTMRTDVKSGIVVYNKNRKQKTDTVNFVRTMPAIPGRPGDNIYNFLYGVDSLQDSLRISEIDSAYRKNINQVLGTDIPFTIKQSKGVNGAGLQRFNEVTIGLANPVTYHLELGKTFPYLIKQIKLPILFSILLSGITILSFVLLYKSLLRQHKLALMKNDFISNITHELKTPIATVGVAIEALKNFNAIDDPKRTREYLDISQNELQRLGLLVDKVLKLSMFEKKEVDLKYETVNLKDIVEEVASSLKLQLEKNRARIWITDEGSTTLQGDRLHLLSVVFNLVDNAIKYSKGEASVQVVIKEGEKDIVLSVTDNGIGIEPAYKDKIFEKFFRVPQGDTHNAKGYGLGLSYVAQVIKKHNGTISVESQPGIGTKFTITLPKERA